MESTDQIINNPEAPLTQGLRKSVGWIMIVGIIFVATNLRAPLTSVGPLAGLIRDSLHISNTLAGLITTLPLLAFALFSPFVPGLGRRWGMERMILISVTFLTLGIMIRWLPGAPALYAGTAVLGLAISVCNVLLPAFIKREFPTKIGLLTGVYSISMNLFGAIASGISVPVAVGLGLGWPTSLGIWGVLSLASIMVWLPQLKRRGIPSGAAPLQADNQDVSLWRSPLAWQVTLFMGLQSTVFYVLIAWLPEILKLQGVGSDQSGWLLSIMQLSLLPFTFVVPVLAGRMSSQRPLVIIMSILLLMGTLGLVYGSSNLIVLWIILLGIGGGFAFSLAMMFFGLRTRSAHQAAELSGMAQSFGYLLAAAGPTLFGYLHDATQSWTIPLLILVGASVLLLIVGLGASRDRYIDSAK
ncbi:CynX/NimT family MFS transporter [Paenibacillus tuaregi]|uniref:CynX/NimT family MFS transporter n=1 Tax=Paenibacillus tuaregi TaxID=1816681 RepID=UPI000837E5C5|nr:MFS transporter [Paenibacillus tuaregi]